GWTGGTDGGGDRIKVKYTRAMSSAVLAGKMKDAEYQKHPIFNLNMPTAVPNVPSEVLNPKDTWEDKEAYDKKARELANSFKKNFDKFRSYAIKEILIRSPASDLTSVYY